MKNRCIRTVEAIRMHAVFPILGTLFLVACAGKSGPEQPTVSETAQPSTVDPSDDWGDTYRLVGGEVPGLGVVDIEVREGVITAVGSSDLSLTTIDLSGTIVEPGWIDSHVHLAFLPKARELAEGGVAVAVDLASPIAFLDDLPSALEVLPAGPMITAVGGYPTQSWGANGYGLEVTDAVSAIAATEQLWAAGARVIKLPINGAAVLNEAELSAVVQAAHGHDLKVVSHATTDAEAALAANVGCDVLAHTPVAALTDETIALWSDRTVITTLAAFGGSDTTIDNLRRLKAAGSRVLYGTDFGNTQTAGVDPRELTLMADAGMTPEEILASGTSVPAAFWGLDDYGEIAVGKRAVFRLVDAE